MKQTKDYFPTKGSFAVVRIFDNIMSKVFESGFLNIALEERRKLIQAHMESTFLVIDDKSQFQHDISLNEMLDIKSVKSVKS